MGRPQHSCMLWPLNLICLCVFCRSITCPWSPPPLVGTVVDGQWSRMAPLHVPEWVLPLLPPDTSLGCCCSCRLCYLATPTSTTSLAPAAVRRRWLQGHATAVVATFGLSHTPLRWAPWVPFFLFYLLYGSWDYVSAFFVLLCCSKYHSLFFVL